MSKRSLCAGFAATLFFASLAPVRADGPAGMPYETYDTDAAVPETEPAAQEAAVQQEPAPQVARQPAEPVSKKPVRIERADSFVAPKDWEFDGFVAGGKDQESRSMFYLNDLVYLNVGTEHGFTTGDHVRFFKRGEKVRDPQNGKLLGYEVRMTASGRVTDRAGEKTCAVRILKANEAVEIGDLVRREE